MLIIAAHHRYQPGATIPSRSPRRNVDGNAFGLVSIEEGAAMRHADLVEVAGEVQEALDAPGQQRTTSIHTYQR